MSNPWDRGEYGEKRRLDVTMAEDLDEEAIVSIKDAQKRLLERVNASRADIGVILGEAIWNRLHGDYYDVEGRAMSIEGMSVMKKESFPENRAMLVAPEAFQTIRTGGDDTFRTATDAEVLDDVSFDNIKAPVLADPSAIEFVPEFEVSEDD